jgi:hypothetical protein
MNSPTSPRLALLPMQPRGAGKRPAIRRYTLGRVHDLDLGPYLKPIHQGAPASTGVRAP